MASFSSCCEIELEMSKRLSFKLKAVDTAGKKQQREWYCTPFTAARKFKVHIREWCKQKKVMLKLKKEKGNVERKCVNGGGRKVHDEQMEGKIFIQLDSCNDLCVTRCMIRARV